MEGPIKKTRINNNKKTIAKCSESNETEWINNNNNNNNDNINNNYYGFIGKISTE